jgi:hypothetical protein
MVLGSQRIVHTKSLMHDTDALTKARQEVIVGNDSVHSQLVV